MRDGSHYAERPLGGAPQDGFDLLIKHIYIKSFSATTVACERQGSSGQVSEANPGSQRPGTTLGSSPKPLCGIGKFSPPYDCGKSTSSQSVRLITHEEAA